MRVGGTTAKYLALLCLWSLLINAASSYAQPTFTGDAAADFGGLPDLEVIPDIAGIDVGVPVQFPPGTISGWDFSTIYMWYDDDDDVMYVGIDCYGICGDADGDGDPSVTSAELAGLGGVDLADYGGTEYFALLFDMDQDGTYDAVVGVSSSATFSSFGAANFSGSPFAPGFAFGSSLPNEVSTHANPSASNPDLEFTIEDISTFPISGASDGSDDFDINVSQGSFSDAGVGEDFIPAAGTPYTPGLALPVELVSFEARADGGTVLLRWETASEINNAGFEIHSKPGGSDADDEAWEGLGFVEGYGTTEVPRSYRFRVDDLDPGRYTFRLKQVDYDASFEYSPEVEVVVEMADQFIVEPAYPNPFNPEAQMRFAVNRRQVVRMDLYDVMGRQVQSLFEGPSPAGQIQTVRIDGSALPSGTYMVRLTGETFVDTQVVTLMK